MMGRGRVLSGVVALASAALMGSCGSSLPLPETCDHSGDEPVIVPYPPPAPQVEIVPEMPKKEAELVWIDGEWAWRGRRWEWQKGRWEVAVPGAKFAPPTVVFLADQQIAWFAGRWHAGAKP